MVLGTFFTKIWKNVQKKSLRCNRLAAGRKNGKKWFRAISGMPLCPWSAWTLAKYILESPSRKNMNILVVLGTLFTKIVYYYVLHMKLLLCVTLIKYILESPSRENMNILMVLGTFSTKIWKKVQKKKFAVLQARCWA